MMPESYAPDRKELRMRRVVFNRKGGVGKSTITCNLAAVAASRGRRALVVDLDPQGNTTRYLLGAPVNDSASTLASFFEQTLGFRIFRDSASAFIHHTPFEGLDLMPSDPELEPLHNRLESRYKIYKLKELLATEESSYDEVWIDTPPSMGFYTLSALIAADRCLIPFDCDDFSRQALYSLLATVEEVQEDHNPELIVEAIVWSTCSRRALGSPGAWWTSSKQRSYRWWSRSCPRQSRSASPTRRAGRWCSSIHGTSWRASSTSCTTRCRAPSAPAESNQTATLRCRESPE